MKIAKLPNILKPVESSLKRIGDKHDGGYLVSFESLLDSDCLISFGLEENWSFETEFSKKNDIDIYCFDASVSQKHFRNKLIKTLFRFDRPQYFFQSLKTYINYRSFFDNPIHHHIQKYVTYDRKPDHTSFQKIIDEILSKYENVFFKIDIEGSEYRILDQLINIQDKITSLVIEFHDVDVNLKKILDFSSSFRLPIINLNVNNNGLISTNNLPTVIEVTYSNPDKKNNYQDQNSINNLNFEEILINFENNL